MKFFKTSYFHLSLVFLLSFFVSSPLVLVLSGELDDIQVNTAENETIVSFEDGTKIAVVGGQYACEIEIHSEEDSSFTRITYFPENNSIILEELTDNGSSTLSYVALRTISDKREHYQISCYLNGTKGGALWSCDSFFDVFVQIELPGNDYTWGTYKINAFEGIGHNLTPEALTELFVREEAELILPLDPASYGFIEGVIANGTYQWNKSSPLRERNSTIDLFKWGQSLGGPISKYTKEFYRYKCYSNANQTTVQWDIDKKNASSPIIESIIKLDENGSVKDLNSSIIVDDTIVAKTTAINNYTIEGMYGNDAYLTHIFTDVIVASFRVANLFLSQQGMQIEDKTLTGKSITLDVEPRSNYAITRVLSWAGIPFDMFVAFYRPVEADEDMILVFLLKSSDSTQRLYVSGSTFLYENSLTKPVSLSRYTQNDGSFYFEIRIVPDLSCSCQILFACYQNVIILPIFLTVSSKEGEILRIPQASTKTETESTRFDILAGIIGLGLLGIISRKKKK